MESPPRRPPAGTLARLGQGCSPGGRGRPRGAGVPLPAEGKYLQSRDQSQARERGQARLALRTKISLDGPSTKGVPEAEGSGSQGVRARSPTG